MKNNQNHLKRNFVDGVNETHSTFEKLIGEENNIESSSTFQRYLVSFNNKETLLHSHQLLVRIALSLSKILKIKSAPGAINGLSYIINKDIPYPIPSHTYRPFKYIHECLQSKQLGENNLLPVYLKPPSMNYPFSFPSTAFSNYDLLVSELDSLTSSYLFEVRDIVWLLNTPKLSLLLTLPDVYIRMKELVQPSQQLELYSLVLHVNYFTTWVWTRVFPCLLTSLFASPHTDTATVNTVLFKKLHPFEFVCNGQNMNSAHHQDIIASVVEGLLDLRKNPHYSTYSHLIVESVIESLAKPIAVYMGGGAGLPQTNSKSVQSNYQPEEKRCDKEGNDDKKGNDDTGRLPIELENTPSIRETLLQEMQPYQVQLRINATLVSGHTRGGVAVRSLSRLVERMASLSVRVLTQIVVQWASVGSTEASLRDLFEFILKMNECRPWCYGMLNSSIGLINNEPTSDRYTESRELAILEGFNLALLAVDIIHSRLTQYMTQSKTKTSRSSNAVTTVSVKFSNPYLDPFLNPAQDSSQDSQPSPYSQPDPSIFFPSINIPSPYIPAFLFSHTPSSVSDMRALQHCVWMMHMAPVETQVKSQYSSQYFSEYNSPHNRTIHTISISPLRTSSTPQSNSGSLSGSNSGISGSSQSNFGNSGTGSLSGLGVVIVAADIVLNDMSMELLEVMPGIFDMIMEQQQQQTHYSYYLTQTSPSTPLLFSSPSSSASDSSKSPVKIVCKPLLTPLFFASVFTLARDSAVAGMSVDIKDNSDVGKYYDDPTDVNVMGITLLSGGGSKFINNNLVYASKSVEQSFPDAFTRDNDANYLYNNMYNQMYCYYPLLCEVRNTLAFPPLNIIHHQHQHQHREDNEQDHCYGVCGVCGVQQALKRHDDYDHDAVVQSLQQRLQTPEQHDMIQQLGVCGDKCRTVCSIPYSVGVMALFQADGYLPFGTVVEKPALVYEEEHHRQLNSCRSTQHWNNQDHLEYEMGVIALDTENIDNEGVRRLLEWQQLCTYLLSLILNRTNEDEEPALSHNSLDKDNSRKIVVNRAQLMEYKQNLNNLYLCLLDLIIVNLVSTPTAYGVSYLEQFTAKSSEEQFPNSSHNTLLQISSWSNSLKMCVNNLNHCYNEGYHLIPTNFIFDKFVESTVYFL